MWAQGQRAAVLPVGPGWLHLSPRLAPGHLVHVQHLCPALAPPEPRETAFRTFVLLGFKKLTITSDKLLGITLCVQGRYECAIPASDPVCKNRAQMESGIWPVPSTGTPALPRSLRGGWSLARMLYAGMPPPSSGSRLLASMRSRCPRVSLTTFALILPLCLSLRCAPSSLLTCSPELSKVLGRSALALLWGRRCRVWTR